MNYRNEIIKAGKKFCVAITGGGSSFIETFLSEGGASSVFNGAIVPYGQEVFDSFIKTQPQKYCSKEAAIQLATQAKLMADSNDYGIGITASLRKAGKEREGRKHFFHIAIRGRNSLFHHHREFSDEDYSRTQQEEIVANHIYLAFAEVLGISKEIKSENKEQIIAEDCVWELFDSSKSRILLTSPNEGKLIPVNPADRLSTVVYPGTFNPWHDGHAAIAAKAADITGINITLEVSIETIGKERLDLLEFNRRYLKLVEAIENEKHISKIIVSNNSRFVDKIRQLANSTIVVGFDTILRIADNTFWENFEYIDFLDDLEDKKIRFLVFHRLTTDKDIPKIEKNLREFCDFAETEKRFQEISSTEVR